jgi:tetratricopeptide (TPR) repeat protein
MSKPAPLLFNLAATAIGIAAIAGLQTSYDNSSAAFKKAERKATLSLSEPLIPSIAALKALSLGDPQVVADMLWLQTIQYFGVGSAYSNYPALGPMLDSITQLDPKFEYPYELGTIVLPFMENTPKAIVLGERAQTSLRPDQLGFIDFYHASNYLLNVKDYEKAAFYYKKSASEPNHPGAAARLAGIAYSKLNHSLSDRQIAIDYWQTVEDNAKSDDEATQARSWKEHMQIVFGLEQISEIFKTKEGRYPLSVQELVDKKYIQTVPVSPVHRKLILSPSTGKVDFSQLENEE